MQRKTSSARRDNARKHAIKRARQRWNVELSKGDVDRIVASLQHGSNGVELLVRQSCSRSLFNVPWKGSTGDNIMLPTVYNTKIRMICTILPPNWRLHYDEHVLDREENAWLHANVVDENQDGDIS